MTWRFISLIVVISAAYLFLFFHLYQLQLVSGGYYSARAESQYAASGILLAKRGTIYFTDKNNNHLAAAINKDFPVIYAVPKAIDDAAETARRLALLANLSVSDLEIGLSDKNSAYKLIQRKAPSELARKVEEEKITGVYTDLLAERFYPLGSLASHLLGFVGLNSDDNTESGRYGLEKFYDSALAGNNGQVKGNKIVPANNGQNLILTIEPNIQIEAERILADLVKNNKAPGGSVIVEEPATGKILAMAGYPNFDPNNYSQANVANFLNPAVQKIYEPGSVLKVITMSAGIDSGKLTLETTYFDTGSVTVSGKRIENYDLKTHGPYGRATMTNVLEHSINTGAVFAEHLIGNELFRSYLIKFGLADKTGVDLPGELKGNLKPLFQRGAAQVNFATASFGQGIAVTPLELITAVSTIANSGRLMRPYVSADLEPQVLADVVSPSTSRLVTQMMVSAVDKAGVAKINGYSLAGKTGTAFVPDFKNGGYTDKVINTYIGFGPASNPRFIALIKLDEPVNAPLAALTVVPAFRDLAQFVLNYYNIPPDRL